MNIVGIDIETSLKYPQDLPHRKAKIFCVAVRTKKGRELYEGERIKQLKPMLEDGTIMKVIHNFGFDGFWLLMIMGIRVRNVWDSKIMEHVLLGENLPQRKNLPEDIMQELSSSLKYTLIRYGLVDYNIKEEMSGEHFLTRPINLPLNNSEKKYALTDVEYLPALQAMQQSRLLKLDLMRVATLENKLVEVTVAMRANGLLLDVERWKKVAAANDKLFNDKLKRLPPRVENWNSPAQVKKYFQSRGVPLTTFDDLDKLDKQYNDPILHQFVNARSFYKNSTTYGLNWLSLDVKETGRINSYDKDFRIRSDFDPMKDSGRYGSSKPNVQNIPVLGDFRSCIVPAKGYVFVSADYDGQEIGIAAAASKEEVWIKAILRGDDIHSMTATILFGERWKNGAEKGCVFPKKCECKAHKEIRQPAKIFNFSVIYGATASTVLEKLQEEGITMTLREARKLLIRFKKAVPRLTRWAFRNSEDTFKTRISYSADIYRRRRVLRNPSDWELITIGKNNPVQSSGANMIKLAMISLDKKWAQVLTEHDRIVLEVKKSYAKKACKDLKIIMEKAADYCTGIPGLIKADPKVLTSLAKK